nr:tetratricopeptide repeat protein [Euryarchaeota archaeon]
MSSMTNPEEVLATVRQAMSSGDLETAEATLKDARKRWKSEPEFAVRHANVLVKQGKHAQALKVYRKVMKKAPERLDACIGAAECAIQTGKGRLAEKLYSRGIGLGLSLDDATLGIARSLVIRSQHHLAWEKAIVQFKSSGNKSKGLHDLLKEISPQTGISVPVLDQFDTAVIDDNIEGVRRDNIDPRLAENTFAAGSLEAMAGVDRATLVETGDLLSDDLLAVSSSGGTSLGIDLSALQEANDNSNPDATAAASDIQNSDSQGVVDIDVSESSETTDDDDLFDGWPDI